MDSIDLQRIYTAAAESLLQNLNSFRAIHRVYLQEKIDDIAHEDLISDIEDVEYSLSIFLQNNV